MTSQRFLNDKVNSRDFLRSLKDACLAPILALIVLCCKYIIPLVGCVKELKTNLKYKDLLSKHEIISYFGGAMEDYDYYYVQSMIPIIMCLLGMLMALMLFKFAFKKKSVNVYFSVGLTRTRLFVNRIIAGAIELFAASVIPLFITFMVNVSLFGYNVHQLKLFAYYTGLMFTSGMAGFVIGAFAASISGSVIEMVITSGSTSSIVLAAVALLSCIKSFFLRGYVGEDIIRDSKILLLSPWTGLSEKTMANMLITGNKVPTSLLITWKANVFPIVFWAIASIVIFALGLFLFKKRKAENSNSFGKFDISSAVNGVFCFFISVIALAEIFYDLYGYKINSVALCIILCALGSCIAFVIAELIIRRNIKAVLRMLPVLGGAVLFAICSLIVIGTGYFGTYNKLPEAKDIEFVSMSYSDPLHMFNYTTYYSTEEYNDEKNSSICKSSNPEDIKLCIEQFNNIKDDKINNNVICDYVDFVIKTKDGKFIVRSFPVYSEDVIHDYNKAVFNSDYFHQILKMRLDGLATGESEDDMTYSAYDVYEYSQIPEDEYMGANTFNYFDGSLLSDDFNYSYHGFSGENTLSYEFTQELIDALYNDLCKMTYEEYYGNVSEPIGAIASSTSTLMLETLKYTAGDSWLDFYRYYYDDSESAQNTVKTGVAVDSILIYQKMTETLEQLNGFEPNPHETEVKAVVYPDKKLMLSNATDNLQNYMRSYTNNRIFVSGNEGGQDYWLYSNQVKKLFGEKTEGNYLDFMEIVYNANDSKLTRVDDTEKAKKISDASQMVYDTYKDNGRYVYVIYEDGTVVPKYLPEKSLSVLN